MTAPVPTEGQPGPVLRQIGVTADGAPLYAYRDTSPVVGTAPAPAPRPWGAYIGVGILGVAAVTALGMVAAVLALAVSVGAISTTVCLLVLRSMWQDWQRQQGRK